MHSGYASEALPDCISEENLVLSGVRPVEPHSCIHALGMQETVLLALRK